MTRNRPGEQVTVGGLSAVGGALAVLLVVGGCTSGTDTSTAPEPERSQATLPVDGSTSLDIGVPRAVHRATGLADGRVLLTGGCSAPGCEEFEDAADSVLVSADGTVSPASSMQHSRAGHTATLLADGRVLVAGGYPGEGQPPTATVEVYDPAADAFTDAGSLASARADHTATLLPDGRVLLTGGRGADGQSLSSVEIVDPSTGEATSGPTLPAPRTGHTATTAGGCVLLVGGTSETDTATRTTSRWCPGRAAWSAGPELARARVKHAATVLPGGGVWVVGGAPTTESRHRFRDTEILQPGARRFVPGPDLPSGRYKITDAIATLADGRVVVAGGRRLVVFDPASQRLRPVRGAGGDLGSTRSFQTVTPVAGGRVLVAGGYDAAIAPTDMAWLVQVAR